MLLPPQKFHLSVRVIGGSRKYHQSLFDFIMSKGNLAALERVRKTETVFYYLHTSLLHCSAFRGDTRIELKLSPFYLLSGLSLLYIRTRIKSDLSLCFTYHCIRVLFSGAPAWSLLFCTRCAMSLVVFLLNEQGSRHDGYINLPGRREGTSNVGGYGRLLRLSTWCITRPGWRV